MLLSLHEMFENLACRRAAYFPSHPLRDAATKSVIQVTQPLRLKQLELRKFASFMTHWRVFGEGLRVVAVQLPNRRASNGDGQGSEEILCNQRTALSCRLEWAPSHPIWRLNVGASFRVDMGDTR